MQWLASFILLLFVACSSSDKTISQENPQSSLENVVNVKFSLFEEQCGICHAVQPPKKVAPTLRELTDVYTMKFQDSSQFVQAIVTWVTQPSEALSLIPGAINEHRLMPQIPFKSIDVQNIADWMWKSTTCSEEADTEQVDFQNC